VPSRKGWCAAPPSEKRSSKVLDIDRWPRSNWRTMLDTRAEATATIGGYTDRFYSRPDALSVRPRGLRVIRIGYGRGLSGSNSCARSPSGGGGTR
jgi:hypothetical protein